MNEFIKTITGSSSAPFTVTQGITEAHIQALLSYSTDKEDKDIQQFTSDPQRFANRENFNAWLMKGRMIYTLLSQDNELKGIIWFGKSRLQLENIENPDNYPFTFAIRLYKEARGQKLAGAFMQASFQDFALSDEYKSSFLQGIWLETRVENVAARATYARFGFKELVTVSDLVYMVLTEIQYLN